MSLRSSVLHRLETEDFDVLVLGGGINGAVSAACAAARGARVALIDRGDFAGFTSQESSNLAWGGIKYLETYEFGLVRKLCVSRNRLLRAFPSTVQELRFFVTLARGFRHGRLTLLLGAWLYWILGSFFTRPPRLLSLRTIADDEPVVRTDGAVGGFEYSDAYLHDNDARFVWSFIRGALDHGAAAANYVESLGATREGDRWIVRVREVTSGREFTVRAKTLVNACGPFVDAHNALTGVTTAHRHAFSKGIHLLVPRVTANKRVLTFFADDGRLFFVIPMGARTCIGTTDTKVDDPHATVTDDDRRFVLDNINKRLRLPAPLTEGDVLAERCGVRPLAVTGGGESSDWLQLSRKHVVEVDGARAHVSIFGGKLTDCLNVGEEVVAELTALGVRFPHPDRRWYGEPGDDVRDAFLHQAALMNLDALAAPGASEPLTSRLWRRYGGAALTMLEEIRCDARMGEVLIEGSEYLRCELEHTARREMVVRLDDFLRRRSKVALVMGVETLREAPGLREACAILFGERAEDEAQAYFASRG
jgi:glycerol-3-phosphate dehydrogenase